MDITIKIKIKEKEVELTLDEAKELLNQLQVLQVPPITIPTESLKPRESLWYLEGPYTGTKYKEYYEISGA